MFSALFPLVIAWSMYGYLAKNRTAICGKIGGENIPLNWPESSSCSGQFAGNCDSTSVSTTKLLEHSFDNFQSFVPVCCLILRPSVLISQNLKAFERFNHAVLHQICYYGYYQDLEEGITRKLWRMQISPTHPTPPCSSFNVDNEGKTLKLEKCQAKDFSTLDW